jgi:branched-chain amino acid transport system ATP-binding protein
MLEVRALEVTYGDFQVLWGVDMTVGEGEMICLLGPNGAGKSSILNAITGLVPRNAGSVRFNGHDLEDMPTHRIVRLGLGHVLERRRLFPTLSVHQNLILGSFTPEAKKHREENLAWVIELFPLLGARAADAAGVLSGGQQQMVAIARGLMARPRLLMIDEPFLGLSPIAVDEIMAVLKKINEEGISVLFTEQNVQLALSLSHRGYLLESGRMVLQGSGREMLENDLVKKVYLGVH